MNSNNFVTFCAISLCFMIGLRSVISARSDTDHYDPNLDQQSSAEEPNYRFLKRDLKKLSRKSKYFRKFSDANISVSDDDVRSYIKVTQALLQGLRHETAHNTNANQAVSSSIEECEKGKLEAEHADDGAEVVEIPKNADSEISLKSLMYREPGSWSPCTKACRTKRIRKCRMHGLCSEDVKVEEAFCYFPGSRCEQEIKDSQAYDTDYTYEDSHADYDHYDTHIHEEDYQFWNDPTKENPDEDEGDEPEPDAEVHNLSEEVEYGTEESSSAENECGIAPVSAPRKMFRIIGGKETVKGSWPWQVAILDRFKYVYCGGTIIGPRWVLTAAHCVQRKISVRIHEHDTSIRDGERQIKVKKAYVNPQYDIDTYDGDIALLKLKSDVSIDFSKPVRSACLPESKYLPKKETCVVLGWGKEKNYHLYGSDVLRYAKVPIVGNRACQKVYRHHEITPNMFCAGYLKGGVDTCSGDSGGPLLCQDKNERWVVHGVTSFGEGCGERGMLGVYVKVSNYMQWINQTMTDN